MARAQQVDRRPAPAHAPSETQATNLKTPPLVALWDAPAWASESRAEEDYIEHRREIGVINPEDGDTPFLIEVVQRDQITLATTGASVARAEALVAMAGESLTASQARQLARLLSSAADLLETASSGTSQIAD